MKKSLIAMVALAALTATAAHADNQAGEALYQAQCASCHGKNAEGMAAFPKLTGKTAEELTAKLEIYRSGGQIGPMSAVMTPTATALSEDDMANVTAYIASVE